MKKREIKLTSFYIFNHLINKLTAKPMVMFTYIQKPPENHRGGDAVAERILNSMKNCLQKSKLVPANAKRNTIGFFEHAIQYNTRDYV
jgi:hypothetical protein